MMLATVSSAWCARTAALAGRLTLLVVLLLWAALSLPNLGLRAFHFEEGRNALHALSLGESGRWFADTVAGERFVVRLPVQTWAVRGFAAITGGVDEWAVRLPALVAVFGTVLLVHRVARIAAGASAGAFAAASFLASLGVIQRLRLGEPDMAIMALSFAAFVVWFDGVRRGHVAWWRWIACGLLMAAVCGFKGPQPCAYFLAGAGTFALVRRRWAQLPGLVVAAAFPFAAFAAWIAATVQPGDAPLWIAEMRISSRSYGSAGSIFFQQGRFAAQVLIEWLPPLLLAAPLWWRLSRTEGPARDLPLALLLYALTVTLVLVAWPGARARYALPAVPAVAVAAGLGFHALRESHPRLLAAGVTIGAGAVAYHLVLVVGVMTLLPGPFTRNRDAARAMEAAVAERPAPILMTFPAHNVAAYLPSGVRGLAADGVAAHRGPAWVLGLDWQLAALRGTNARLGEAVPMPVATDPPFALAPLAAR